MKLARTAAALPLAAALVLGGSMAASASAADAADQRTAGSASDVHTQEEWVYIQDFYWQTDCVAKGEQMLREGLITKFHCDGSESPFDDYSLFVVFG